MATLAECSDALETRLATAIRHAYANPPQGVQFPYAHVEFVGWEPIAMGRAGQKTYLFSVKVYTAQTARPQDGYEALLEYADSSGAKSIELAIWDGNDQPAGTFGGLANTSAFVSGMRVVGVEDTDAYQGYGGEFEVQIQTRS